MQLQCTGTEKIGGIVFELEQKVELKLMHNTLIGTTFQFLLKFVTVHCTSVRKA